MSKALYHKIASLPFWDEKEIERREAFVSLLSSDFRRVLQNINSAFRVFRVEGPCLTPEDFVSEEYSKKDVFYTNHKKAGQTLLLRAETTASSYAAMKKSQEKLPFCFWQVGKSFRTESNDGASASKLRFNEFWQLEFQVAFKKDTKADYRSALIESLRRNLNVESRIVESDRLPSYSVSTIDVEVQHNLQWREIASCSLRSDYREDVIVCEIAIGLDRVISTGSF